MEPYATVAQIWTGGLIFARIGSMVMVLPGWGESYVPPRIRLTLALMLTLVVWPLVAGSLPALPESLASMVGWVIREVLTGLAVGVIIRFFMTAVATAGEIISMQTTLGFAQSANPTMGQPSSTLGSFLALFSVTLLFATNTHHWFVAGLLGTYEAISPLKPLIASDFTTVAVKTLSQSFLLGVQLAAPVIVFALIFNLACGLVARVMPSFQVYFAAAPLSVLLGLSLFALSLGIMGTIFVDRIASVMRALAGGSLG